MRRIAAVRAVTAPGSHHTGSASQKSGARQRGRSFHLVSLALIALSLGSASIGTRPAAAAAACLLDTGGADDQNANQKDLNEFCQSVGNDGGLAGCTSADANLTWTWDDTGWTGSNTGDACALYDTDDDGNANFALCATVGGDPASQASGSPRFYLCDDSKALNCGGAMLQTATSSCTVSSADDPFSDAHQGGNYCTGTDCGNDDTQAQCCVKIGDFPANTTPELIDVCSYPSSAPSSSPSECVKAVLCNTDTECSELDDACNTGTCASDGLTKRCVATPKTDGTTCNDHDACTQTDTCQAGVCTGGNAVSCTASDQCHVAGTCNPATGTCSNPTAPNGTGCSDGNACTQTDTCQAGVCSGGNAVSCTASDQCHVAGTCNPATGTCSNPNAPNGTTCTDNNACTVGDTCQNGACSSGTAVMCTTLDQCHVKGTCDTATGICSNPNAPDGTTCTDHDACTLSDTCQDGTCVGGNGPTTDPGCKTDTGGPDDAVGQKDLSEFCLNVNAMCAGTVLTWQWDDTAWSGGNTGDACALYDTQGDGFADYALCVTVGGKPAVQLGQSPRFYTCNNTKSFNCAGATLRSNVTTTCTVKDLVADPFANRVRKGNKCTGSSCFAKDTQASCCVKTADLPGTAALIDVCSYPSQSPSSDPSECVKTVFCTSNSDCTVTSGEGTCTGMCANVGGVNQCTF